jgi:hypothetical protein
MSGLVMKSRELVKRTLEFKNTGTVPRDLWTLPWAYNNYGAELESILEDYPPDIVQVPDSHKIYAEKPVAQCEFGAGANPANVRQMFKSWKEIQG